jgi:hypothetical protein
MMWSQKRARYQCILTLVTAALLITPARAQQANIRSVSFSTIKPDRVSDFIAATKEYAGVMAKGGSERSFSVWHSLTGANEYALVRMYRQWAELDAGPEPKMKEQATQLQGINTRIVACIESSHRVIDEILPDLSFSQSDPVQMIRVLRTRVRPEKVDEYLAMVKSEVLPAAKKAGLKAFSVAQQRYGAPGTEFISVAGMTNWGDLDGGTWIQKAMGAEVYQRFLAKLRPLTVESEAIIYRLVPDSSYSAPAK